MSWVSGENAIWYNPNLNSWGIGALDDLGSEIVGIGKTNCELKILPLEGTHLELKQIV